jgi:hypothetical protein
MRRTAIARKKKRPSKDSEKERKGKCCRKSVKFKKGSADGLTENVISQASIAQSSPASKKREKEREREREETVVFSAAKNKSAI